MPPTIKEIKEWLYRRATKKGEEFFEELRVLSAIDKAYRSGISHACAAVRLEFDIWHDELKDHSHHPMVAFQASKLNDILTKACENLSFKIEKIKKGEK